MSIISPSKDRAMKDSIHVLSHWTLMRGWKRACYRIIIPCIILMMFCAPVGVNQNQSNLQIGDLTNETLQNWFRLSEGLQEYSSTGAAQPVSFNGLFTNNTQDLVIIDSSTPTAVSIQAPSGWTGSDLSGSLEYLSTDFKPLKNSLLDDYHAERYIIEGSPWNSEVFNVPDDWSVFKGGDSTTHPTHGGLYWFDIAGSGREGSMGWRPSVLFSAGSTLNPDMELYLSQEIQLPWREVYSCEVQFYHRVPSGQNMNGIFYLFVDVGGYREKFNVFSSGYIESEWIQGVVEIPAAVFSNIPVPGTVTLEIGISTDFSGNSPSDINNRVLIDEIEAVFKARPFPEQIGLKANQTLISGSISSSVSPYVPDDTSDHRDCADDYSTGLVSQPLRVGVYGADWTSAGKYKIGMQFPLGIPQGASISSAHLEIEAYGRLGGVVGIRIYVAQADNVTPFTTGLPHLEDRFDWSRESIEWTLDPWNQGTRYKSPDISPLVQEVISRPGWSSGNYICLMLDYMYGNEYQNYVQIKGSADSGGEDLERLFVDFAIPKAEDTIYCIDRKTLTIDHTKVSSDLQNFPVLVDIYDADLKTKAQPDGRDIKFMIGSLTLDHEIELFDPDYSSTQAHLVAWVKVPMLSASTDTTITMSYGDPFASSQENPYSIWEGYESVWHLSEESGSGAFLGDSSQNGYNGTPGLTTFMQDAKIDGARYFEDVYGNYITFTNGENIFDGWADWQFSFWVYFNYSSDAEWTDVEPRLFDKGTCMNLIRTFRGSSGWPAGMATFQVDIHFASGYNSYFNVYVKRQTWNFIVFKYESTGDGRLRAYNFVDGELLDSNSDSGMGAGNRLRDDSNMFMLGIEDGGQIHLGGIDEFRTINGYKSAAWIQTEYANQYNPSSFYSVGAEESIKYSYPISPPRQNATLLFTSDAPSVVSILPRMTLNITTQESTLDNDMMPGTSFSVANGTDVTWTANVLASPPLGVKELGLNFSKPITWTLTNVTDVVGQERFSEVNTTSTQVTVPSSVLDVKGIWTFTFSSSNEVVGLDCGVFGETYDTTVVLQTGDLAKFRGTATSILDSAMTLHIVDPSGQLFYSEEDLVQAGGGIFEWAGISVTSAWPIGIWHVFVEFNNTADSSPERVGRYDRQFTVQHDSALQLLSPTDAIGDGISVRTAGELLEIAVQLTDTDSVQNVAGSTVMMNWSVMGIETQVQFEDYGNGVYGKTLNTSDLGQPGNWRLNIVSSHPYLVDAATYFDLELSHNTILTYRTPQSTPYGDDFSVLVNLQDAITGTYYDGASFTSNGTISGVTDYNNGTYLVKIESTGLSLGTHCFTVNAIPAQNFVIESSVDIVFRYREINTDIVQVETNPVSVPWGQNATVTLSWLDIDHASVGITGGVLSGDGTFEYVDLLDGRYSIQIDIDSYSVGIYMFNFTITRMNYQTSEITVAVSIRPHRTLVVATYDGSIPMGSNVTVNLVLLDLDAGNIPISGNLTSVLAEWLGGSEVYGSLQILINSQVWAIGDYTIDITVQTSVSPRYYYDGTTAIVVRIQKLTTALSWDDIGVFPIGDDFEITTYVTVNDSSSIYDNIPVNGLLQSHFSIRDKNGTLYNIKTFSAQGAGTYVLTLDQSYFPGGSYGIRIFLVFGVFEDYSNTQTPIISFQFNQAECDLSSPDYPLLTISWNTDAVVTFEFVDIDRGQGIDTATIYVTGALKIEQQLISSGRYWVTIDTSTWSIGIYNVSFTSYEPNYENKTISIDIQIRQIRTYAIATVSDLEIPVGDSRTFYVDYIDMDHNLPIFTLNHLCNWTPVHYDIVWTGNRYAITINTFDTDTLKSYLLVFDYSSGSEYEAATFSVTVVIRSIETELRLLSPVEDSTPSGQIEISVYYGDRDHLQGIVSSDVLCTVWNTTGQLTITWDNDTSAGSYIIRIDASQFGGLGIQQLTVFFNWTGSIQKYENRFLSISVEIIGEDTELTLIEAALPSPCLDYMVYTFLYSSATLGTGISNDTSNVFISVEFVDVTVDLSQVNIWEIDSTNRPGEYSIGFNNSILGRTGIISMKVFINWSAGVSPFYTNRTDLISVRVLPRSASLSVIPPTSVPFGENATFSFTYEDTTGGYSSPIAYDPLAMIVSLNVPDFTLTYDAFENLYTISFNTSQLGAPLGERTLILNLTWSGLPFYSNVTGRLIAVTLIERQTILTYPTPPVTPYGNIASFTVTYVDIAGSTSTAVLSAIIEAYVGMTKIPSSYVQITDLGSGEYQIDLNTSYFSQPSIYSLRIEASSDQFYYQFRSDTKFLTVNLRATLLTAEPIGFIPYDTSFSIVLHYQDLDTLFPIGNDTGVMTSLEILNGTNWLFTCSWRPSLQNYLLTVETYNQELELGRVYHLWLNFSSEYTEPFYQWNDILVPFEISERDTNLDLISSPSQTHYQDYANFTILFKDTITSTGISGGAIYLYFGLVLLESSIDYEIVEVSTGQYTISVDTSVLGPPGIKAILVIANWSAGPPHYQESQRTINIPVTERPTSVEIVFPPGQTWYLDNVTLDFAFVDISTGQRVVVSISDIKIYSEGTALVYGEYLVQSIGSIFRLQINSTVISANLVSSWNITIQIDWTSGAPYYENDATSVFVDTVGRVGNIELGQVEETPFGDIMNITLIYTDQREGIGIEGATIVLTCIEVPGLIEGTHYWVQMGTGIDSGQYRILISTSLLGSIGIFTFEIEIQWSALVSPYYGNVFAPEIQGIVREIQTSVSSDLPSPSVVAFYEDIAFVILFADTDHGLPIDGAEEQISVRYQSTGLEPSSWSVQALGGGQYNITLSMMDSLAVGLQSVIVTVDITPYQTAQTSVVFGLRNRVAGLSAVIAPTNYAGYATSVMIYLVDYDANDNPLSGASLILTWGDSSSYIDLGDGSYNITLQTGNLNFGSQILTVQASLLHYAISSLNVEINLIAVPSELIVTWSGPRLTNEVYWGEPLTIFAAINDTLRNQIVSVATITYDWVGGTGSFLPTGVLGNYTTILDTSLGTISDTLTVRIEGSAPNYIDSSYQIIFRLLPRPMDVIPEGNRYVFTVSYGDTAEVILYLEDSIDGSLVTEANLVAKWDYETNITLVEIPSRPGYYKLSISTGTTGFGSYQIHVEASKHNYGNASATLIMAISKIQMVVWLDDVTATYEYTSFYWSEVVRIGVYVLAPALNTTDPFSTGLDGLLVTWNSPELGSNGTLLNGILIGGAGYYYYDFDTSLGIAALHTFIISANPPNSDYERADNSTSIFVRNLEATIKPPVSPDFTWGWTGLVNLTYYDGFHEQGVQADSFVFSWAGGSGNGVYLGDGVYGIPIDTTKLRPGTYTITVAFQKANYDDAEMTIRIHIALVPTEIAILLPELYRIGDTWTNLQVPYGDVLTVTLLYNDTYSARGIPDALFNNSFYTGPGVYEDPLVLMNHGNGNYSFVFDTHVWSLYSTISFYIRFMLENYTTAEFAFEITIIKIQTSLEIIGPSVMSLNWGMNTTFWVYYSDAWPGHSGEGITEATVAIDNPQAYYATVEYLGPDESRPGYYQFRVTAFVASGVAEITILLNKTYYEAEDVTLSVSVSPSPEQIAIQTAITYGSAFVIFIILFAIVWVRILRVPKMIRIISGQIRQLRRGRVPKPAKGVSSRQAILAALFNELHEEIGVKRKSILMPEESIIIEVPEIDELVIDLSILTEMTPQELDDFKSEISKMKMSQQTSFVREVISQEVIRVARVQNKSVEQVIEEVVEERRKRIGKAAPPTKPDLYDVVEEDIDVSEPGEEEGIDFEKQLRELELKTMAEQLEKRGIPSHEIESFVSQARELPKDIVEMLLQSFMPKEEPKPVEEKIEHLSEEELEKLRFELIKRDASDREIESIIDQARSLPRELALEFFKEPEKPSKRKRRKKVEKLSKKEREELRAKLVRKKVPEKEIEAIMKEAETAPKERIEEFVKTLEDTELDIPIQEIEFEDRLSDFEIEDLRNQLEQRGLPRDEIESIVKQARSLPSALIDDLLKSIDADLDKK